MDSSFSVSDEGVAGGVNAAVSLSGVDAVDAEDDTSEDAGKNPSEASSSNSKSSVDSPVEANDKVGREQTSDDAAAAVAPATSLSGSPTSTSVDEVAYHVIANQAAAGQ